MRQGFWDDREPSPREARAGGWALARQSENLCLSQHQCRPVKSRGAIWPAPAPYTHWGPGPICRAHGAQPTVDASPSISIEGSSQATRKSPDGPTGEGGDGNFTNTCLNLSSTLSDIGWFGHSIGRKFLSNRTELPWYHPVCPAGLSPFSGPHHILCAYLLWHLTYDIWQSAYDKRHCDKSGIHQSSSTFSPCAPSEQGPDCIPIFISSACYSAQLIVGAQEMWNEWNSQVVSPHLGVH